MIGGGAGDDLGAAASFLLVDASGAGALLLEGLAAGGLVVAGAVVAAFLSPAAAKEATPTRLTAPGLYTLCKGGVQRSVRHRFGALMQQRCNCASRGGGLPAPTGHPVSKCSAAP